MSSYNPPSENIPIFNTLLFNQPEETLSQAEANKLYLSKTTNDTSTATLTTFNGGTSIKGNSSFGVSNTSGGILTLYRKLQIQDINGNATGFGEFYFGSSPELGIYAISVPSTLVQTFVRLYSCAAGSTTSILRFEVGDTTKIFNNLEASSRLNFTGATYSFPFASSQSLGYYLKTTGTGTAVTSATPKTILSTASIPIGVWRIDFSVINLVTSAGTITQSQTYISPTLDGNVGTAVDFTGSVIRTHVSEVYALNDVQEIAGSFTYQQTTAGVLRLNIVKSFGSGTYSFTGEIAITRLA